MVGIDLILINLSLCLAFLLRFDWPLTPQLTIGSVVFMLEVTIIRLALFTFFGMYQWSFRYASISEAMNVCRAITVGSLVLVALAFFNPQNHIGRSVIVIDYLLCLFFVGISRFLPRVIIKFQQLKSVNLKPTLIVGAGAAGEMVARELLMANQRLYKPVGFIDDNPSRLSARIHGIKVLGTCQDIKDIVAREKIEDIIIAIPSAKGKVIRNIISQCENLDVKIKTIPALQQIITGEKTVKHIRDVQPEDLLGRESIQINRDDVRSFIKDKVVLVTGAGGTIGSALCRQIMRFDPSMLIAYDHNENDTYFLQRELKEAFPQVRFRTIIGDIKDIGLLKHTFTKYRPSIIFHAAAHKHVPLMEENPTAAVKNNIIGTRNFIYAAEHYGVESFVMISTDKAVNPSNIMGASKRITEMLIQAKAKTARTKLMAVRFGNVIGSSGSVVPIFKKQIEKGGPVTVTHPDVKRYFMVASEAAQLVLEAGVLGKGGEIFILDMGEQIKIVDLAKNLITLSGFEIDDDIEIKFVGLRQGEKMEERLLDPDRDKATKYDKIFITQPQELDLTQLRRDIKELDRLANVMADDAIVVKMMSMVAAGGEKYDVTKNKPTSTSEEILASKFVANPHSEKRSDEDFSTLRSLK